MGNWEFSSSFFLLTPVRAKHSENKLGKKPIIYRPNASPLRFLYYFSIDKMIPTSEPIISTILLRELIAKPGPRFSAA
ncbi:hypothetical protein FJR38_19345 [Anabaena sp. UHCC 0253]|nr:hypothetical protein [Anabaena sp. UHCC 0204]MTJ54659.1 hypothetical protein [Anabaena sp. UHCC 0253]